MDKVELQYVIVARRCQLPSICFIASAIGTNKKSIGFIAVAIKQTKQNNNFIAVPFKIKNNIGFVASPLWLGRHR